MNRPIEPFDAAARRHALALPPNWVEAIRTIESCARRAHVHYAIVGSLGLAASLGLPWEPSRSSPAHQVGRPRDLDVLLVGTTDTRRQFRESLESAWKGASPTIDLVSWYHAFTEFGPRGAGLRYRAVRIPVDARLFRPVRIPCQGVSIPVLHPRVHRHLIAILPADLAKGRDRIRSLVAGLARDLSLFPGISETDCLAFRTFKAERRRRYPLRERVLAFRMVLSAWEEEGRRSRLVAAKARIREHHPRLTETLRRLFG